MSRSAAPSWALLLVLCGAIFLEGLDIGMLNVALPPIRAELGLSTGALQWVMSGYVLGYGGFMLLGGRAADLFGRRRMFLVPLTVFLVFSGLGGLATEGWMLIAARFVTGVCAAFMAPAGLSIITTSFPAGPRRDRALLIYSGTGGGGFSIGLVAGGLLTAADWRWVFFAPIAPALLVLLAALPLVPKDSVPRRPRPRVDVAGAITVTAAVLLLVMAVEQAAHAPALRTMGTLATALALLAAFVAVERRTPTPCSVWASSAPGRWCAPASWGCCSPPASSASSSSRCSTSRSSAAGRPQRPALRCCRWAPMRYWRRRSPHASYGASGMPG